MSPSDSRTEGMVLSVVMLRGAGISKRCGLVEGDLALKRDEGFSGGNVFFLHHGRSMRGGC